MKLDVIGNLLYKTQEESLEQWLQQSNRYLNQKQLSYFSNTQR